VKRETDLWLVFRQADKGRTADLRRRARDWARDGSWRSSEIVSVYRRVDGRTGRWMLAPGDAGRIYRRAHRARVVVLVLGRSHVAIDPRHHQRPRPSTTWPLPRFLRYKTRVVISAPDTDWDELLPQLENAALWVEDVHIESEHDARCLPLSSFSPDAAEDLDDSAARSVFERHHGRSSKRVDSGDNPWELNPRDFHGHETLQVAGRELPRGFHWDVRPGGRSPMHFTSVEGVWQVPRRAYLNVYPDAHPRPRKGGGVRQLWPTK
jgi:hypothetical protein